MNCHALATIHPGADDDTIADWLQSNICRCTSYEEIANAVKQVLKKGYLKCWLHKTSLPPEMSETFIQAAYHVWGYTDWPRTIGLILSIIGGKING